MEQIIDGGQDQVKILETGNQDSSLSQHEDTSKYKIAETDTVLDTKAIIELWNSTLPTWTIPPSRLGEILAWPGSRIFQTYDDAKIVAICLTQQKSPTTALITALLVFPTHQGQGVGTSLLNHAIKALSESPLVKTIGIGSGFPRFWPGLPFDLPAARKFFMKHGFLRTAEVSSRDLYKDLTSFEMSAAIKERASLTGMTYGPWRKDLVEECLEKQWKNFGHNAAWVKVYEELAAREMYEDVMVVFDSAGRQIAWTLMCGSESRFCDYFAFLPLAGEKVGTISCVGVDKEIRGGGVGLLLMSAAMEALKAKNTTGVFVDWVVIRGFYEKMGFEIFSEYEAFELQVRD